VQSLIYKDVSSTKRGPKGGVARYSRNKTTNCVDKCSAHRAHHEHLGAAWDLWIRIGGAGGAGGDGDRRRGLADMSTTL